MSIGNSREFWGNFLMLVIDNVKKTGCPAFLDLSSATPKNRTLHDKGWNLVCAQRG